MGTSRNRIFFEEFRIRQYALFPYFNGVCLIYAGNRHARNVFRMDTYHIDTGSIFSRVYPFHDGFDYQVHKMTDGRRNIWLAVFENGDSYGRLNLLYLSLSTGSSYNGLNYCHEVFCDFLTGLSARKPFDSLLGCNKMSDSANWIGVYANLHVSVFMLIIWYIVVWSCILSNF